ncbi:hypothetical protein B0H19DRAFT_1070836 [Mycena capillaripes]|nr:hypothetical protein B0H19DRAFT_1070836 [Mycena capillaripes]
MRPLSLHSSALNDAEYTLFTENLASLLDSDSEDFEAQTLSIREVRAWMRGRYPGIPAPTIDRILALFPSKDAIHGGEFFAAHRLVLHVESGKDVDRALAFVQGSAAVMSTPVSAPAASQGITPAPEDAPDPASTRTPQRHNPFLPSTPTLTRSKTAPTSSPAPVLPPRRAAAPPSAPIPPPRHPPLPPRAPSPPKPSTPAHITSTLMKQSLQASKTGQWLKQGQARLEQERVLQVLRSTSTTPRPAAALEASDYMSATSSDGSRGRPVPSIPPSASSLEQVALASPSNALQRAFDDVYREREPPPTHPDRKSAPPSVSSRASASSGSSSRAQPSPERNREKPRPPPKPRSLNAVAQSPFASPPTQPRLTRSNSLRPSPPPPSTRTGRVRPESVHALLGGLGSLRAAESPFGDPVRPHARARGEEREALVTRPPEHEQDSDSDDDVDTDADGSWVGVGRFDDSDADADSPDLSGNRRRQVRGETMSRDSLKWPVDVEGEGWRPL